MGMDDRLVRKKLEALLQNDEDVQAYIRTHGPHFDAAKIKAFQETRIKTAPVAGGDKDSPIFAVQVLCPLCGPSGGKLEAQEMRARALAPTPDKFLAPRYAPISGFRALNFSLAAVTVCPGCLFASPDRKDFVTFAPITHAETKSQISQPMLDELKRRTEERRGVLADVADPAAHFQHPRSPAAALDSYRLALHRAKAEAALETPLSSYKAGQYGLRIALLLRDSGQPDDPVVREAAQHLKASYARNEVPNADLECQLLYLIVAVQLRLGEMADAQSYLGLMEKMRSLPEKPGPDGKGGRPAALERWLDRAKTLWTDREDPELWKH